MIHLFSTHLIIDNQLVEEVFKEETHAFITYSKEQKKLLVTPVSSEWFKKMHQPAQFFLKLKNMKGDRSLDIRQIIIDEDLPQNDRNLQYDLIKKTKLLIIDL